MKLNDVVLIVSGDHRGKIGIYRRHMMFAGIWFPVIQIQNFESEDYMMCDCVTPFDDEIVCADSLMQERIKINELKDNLKKRHIKLEENVLQFNKKAVDLIDFSIKLKESNVTETFLTFID